MCIYKYTVYKTIFTLILKIMSNAKDVYSRRKLMGFEFQYFLALLTAAVNVSFELFD